MAICTCTEALKRFTAHTDGRFIDRKATRCSPVHEKAPKLATCVAVAKRDNSSSFILSLSIALALQRDCEWDGLVLVLATKFFFCCSIEMSFSRKAPLLLVLLAALMALSTVSVAFSLTCVLSCAAVPSSSPRVGSPWIVGGESMMSLSLECFHGIFFGGLAALFAACGRPLLLRWIFVSRRPRFRPAKPFAAHLTNSPEHSRFQSFVPFVPLTSVASTTTATPLFACRVNAKKEKRMRNKENMRKFQKKRGSSRRRLMKKIASGAARQTEMEFVAKLFQTMEGPETTKPDSRDSRR